ncbi:Zn-ribbon domain-containing OB-fold protein [Alteribacillus sp. JSM 102045]|uniref:Zn-ribbon domain-containing OB-fold protein n=1 Tax=Alteribacillus sp. JSM 102045 TaxID=1562101 RepID=UPI0035C18E0F
MSNKTKNMHKDIVTDYYWEHCKKEKLIIQYCNDCKRYQYPPNLLCRHCLSKEITWKESDGSGEIYSYSVVHRPPSAFFKPFVPYVVSLVKLEEGVMMESWIINGLDKESSLQIGTRVKLAFKDFESYKLPVFEITDSAGWE